MTSLGLKSRSRSAPQLSQNQINRCNALFAEAERLLGEGDTIRGYQKLVTASRLAKNRGLVGRGRTVVAKFESAANAMLDEADKQFQGGDYESAMRSYRAISRMYHLDAAKEAKLKVGQHGNDPDVLAAPHNNAAMAMWEKAEKILSTAAKVAGQDCDPAEAQTTGTTTRAADNGQAKPSQQAGATGSLQESLFAVLGDEASPPQPSASTHVPDASAPAMPAPASAAPASDSDGDGTFDLANDLERAYALRVCDMVELLGVLDKIVKTYDDTPAGYHAQLLRDQLLADEQLVAAIEVEQKNAQAKQNLQMAKLYVQNGLRTKAVELLQETTEQFAGTEWAAEAQQQLDSLDAAVASRD